MEDGKSTKVVNDDDGGKSIEEEKTEKLSNQRLFRVVRNKIILTFVNYSELPPFRPKKNYRKSS